jgi:glyoxylate utilization-related uncharacterized protein
MVGCREQGTSGEIKEAIGKMKSLSEGDFLFSPPKEK